jgi:hypothetical protein
VGETLDDTMTAKLLVPPERRSSEKVINDPKQKFFETATTSTTI